MVEISCPLWSQQNHFPLHSRSICMVGRHENCMEAHCFVIHMGHMKWWNAAIFNSKMENHHILFESILYLYNTLNLSKHIWDRSGRKALSTEPRGIPLAYFDGMAQHGYFACGVYIIPMEGQQIEIYWNGGVGSNNNVEVMELVGLLSFCDFLNIQELQIFGDSKVIIDHVRSNHVIKKHQLIRMAKQD